MTQKIQLGKWGEAVALRFFRAKGFVLLERNVRTPYGELDLIMLDGSELVFIEVKTRRGQWFGTGLDALTPKKLLHLEQASGHVLEQWKMHGAFRLDVLAVYQNGSRWHVEHLQNIVMQ